MISIARQVRIQFNTIEKLRSTIVATIIALINNLGCNSLFKDAKETAPLKIKDKYDKKLIYISIAQTSFFNNGLLK